MKTISFILLILAVINLIPITLTIFYKKKNISLALAILEVALITLAKFT